MYTRSLKRSLKLVYLVLSDVFQSRVLVVSHIFPSHIGEISRKLTVEHKFPIGGCDERHIGTE